MGISAIREGKRGRNKREVITATSKELKKGKRRKLDKKIMELSF